MKYLISDIHGCYTTLVALINKIAPTEEDSFYFLGDYIDRGNNSKEVLDFVMSFKNSLALKGNHEWLMQYGYDNHSVFNQCWESNGMASTLRSFPTSPFIPDDYFAFIKNCPLMTKVDDYFISHAGIEDIENPFESNEDVVLWDRSIIPIHNKVICGHTPQTIKEIESSLNTNKIIIDGGCVFKNKGYGNLVALEVETKNLIIQPNVEI